MMKSRSRPFLLIYFLNLCSTGALAWGPWNVTGQDQQGAIAARSDQLLALDDSHGISLDGPIVFHGNLHRPCRCSDSTAPAYSLLRVSPEPVPRAGSPRSYTHGQPYESPIRTSPGLFVNGPQQPTE